MQSKVQYLIGDHLRICIGKSRMPSLKGFLSEGYLSLNDFYAGQCATGKIQRNNYQPPEDALYEVGLQGVIKEDNVFCME